MTDAYTIPPAELVDRLRDHEGEVWETTMCCNHLREAAARRIEELEVEAARLKVERLRVDRRIMMQRARLRWWDAVSAERIAAACRRRIYMPFAKWYPVVQRRANARRVQADAYGRAAE